MLEQRPHTRELACRGDLQRLGYHKDGTILPCGHAMPARRERKLCIRRRATSRRREPDLRKLAARGDGAALDFDSRSYPILLLKELQEGACRYLAAAVRQEEAGARDLV